MRLRATTAARTCTNFFFSAFRTFYCGGLRALTEAVRFHPRCGEEFNVNVQRKSRSRTRVGCNSTRHPLLTGVKYFSRFSTNSAGTPTASRYIVAGPTGQGLSARSGNVTSANQKIAILKVSVRDLAGCGKTQIGSGFAPCTFAQTHHVKGST